ncbi:hypothetical protein SDC9_53272 [bioreactor metagenome]|uniref:Uncharacterized protein n=1 Tax=bioreactor metagenome TaxID=1076179 RepID=A0A644WU20_9ZZZZ
MKLSGIINRSMRNFLCIRGFASLKELGSVSCADEEIQRDLIGTHKDEMAAFLNSGDYTFFPEVILAAVFPNYERLSMLVDNKQGCNEKFGQVEASMSVGNKTKSATDRRIDEVLPIIHLNFSMDALKIFRIDGNHRLSAYDLARYDYNTPYCLLLFSSHEEYKRFSRAIFHNINSKQIPLTLEHNRKVIINGVDTFSNETLTRDPSFGWKYFLTRKTMAEVDFAYFPNINSYLGKTSYTFFIDLYGYLLKNGSILENEEAVMTVKSQLVEIETALSESQITATTTNIAIIGALAYYKLTNSAKYRGFLSWIKKNNLGHVEMLHIDDVIKIYDEIFEHVPRKAFLARWYPVETDTAHAQSVHRVNAIKEVADQLNLNLTDLGTKVEGAFDIRDIMFRDIRDCDVFIADLTGARHNVMIEVGYALKRVGTGRMVFYFQDSENCTSVPFDVSHLSYDKINDSAEIKIKTKARIERILEQAKNGEI